MNDDKSLQLYRAFPGLFLKKLSKADIALRESMDVAASEKTAIDGKYSSLVWGIQCGDGWYDLLVELCTEIERLAKIHDLKPRIVQVKEKFGGLRVGLGWARDEFAKGDRAAAKRPGRAAIIAAIQAAGVRSESVCEQCGAPGQMRKEGYWHVSCDACEAKK